MLDELSRALHDLGLESTSDCILSANFRWAHHLSVTVVTETGNRYFVKVGANGSERFLRTESVALGACLDYVSQHILSPLGLIEQSRLSFLVFPFADIKPCDEFRTIASDPEKLNLWARIFSRLRQIPLQTDIDCQNESMRYFSIRLPALHEYIKRDEVKSALRVQPRAPQHGDMTATNTGLNDDVPVIFDWEDFGKVDLVGFDLAIFLSSMHQHKAIELKDIIYETGPEKEAVEVLCKSIGLDPKSFELLLPVYYGFFYWLKDSYSYQSPVKVTIRDNIEELISKM